jgi:hypothetical protein
VLFWFRIPTTVRAKDAFQFTIDVFQHMLEREAAQLHGRLNAVNKRPHLGLSRWGQRLEGYFYVCLC